MSVAYATRRLWVRRSRRTFYFLTRAFGYVAYALPPMWFFWFYRAWFKRDPMESNDDLIFAGMFLHVLFLPVLTLASWQIYADQDAPASMIQEARAADACFDNTIVRRAEQMKRPISKRDVWVLKSDCEEMWDNMARQKAQAAALANQLEK